ncbi:hypothetical protein LTR10_011521 [Elasticomyces elasticus]|nr:hypothetical protein LTR10_011521 [Elasticomyces elasticus]
MPTGSAVTSTGSAVTSTGSALTSPRRDHTGAIAGGVAGGVIGLVLIALGCALFWRRRRRRRANRDDTSPVTEKAQLHSDDVKPERKELQGTNGSRELLERKPTGEAEMAANEEVTRDNLQELPSNEPPGHEMETTENEMAVLDRLGRLTDSTTLVSSRSKSDSAPET